METDSPNFIHSNEFRYSLKESVTEAYQDPEDDDFLFLSKAKLGDPQKWYGKLSIIKNPSTFFPKHSESSIISSYMRANDLEFESGVCSTRHFRFDNLVRCY